MLVSPVAVTSGITWSHSTATDLPKALRRAFPPSAAGAAATPTEPASEQLALRGTGGSIALRFPASGRWRHAQATGSDVHWVWGAAADVLLHAGLAQHLTLGNPLIAMRFQNVIDATADTGDKKGVMRGDPVQLGGSPVIALEVLIVACVPGAPGLDTLAVLRYAADAMAAAGGAMATSTWQDFVATLAPLESPLRVLEPGGSPATGRSIRIVGGAGPVTLAATHKGDALAALGVTRAGLGAATLDVSGGVEVVASAAGASHADGRVPVTSATSLVTVAALNDWLAPQGSAVLTRFTRRNTVVPFSDGVATYADLFAELNRAADPTISGANGAFYVTGYSLHHDAKLVPASAGLTHRTVADLATAIAANGGDARFLALQMLQLNPGFVETTETVLAVTSLILALAGGVATMFQSGGSEQFSFFVHSEAIAIALFLGSANLDQLLQSFELNRGAIDALAAITGVEAHLDPVDADVADNPRATTTGTLAEAALTAQRKFSAFHQKIQIVRNDRGIHAYCGGIDLNSNRTQTPEHAGRGPFHDVHARINGPAAGELVTTFIQRWDRAATSTLALATAGALDGLPTGGSDVVQVARTYYGPDPASTRGLDFAPTGETTIIDTLVEAIGQARRYIYIEDQYLTPPPVYRAALVAAARNVSGPLIIVVPSSPDQPFGLPRRQEFIQELRDAWGEDRVRVGVLRKRFSHAPTSRESASGRLWLTEDVAELADTVKLSPATRVPATPFWLTVGNEAMRAYAPVAGVTDPVSVAVHVDRGAANRLFGDTSGTTPRAHKARAAVLAGTFRDIYVHAKMMLIDDAFASIGSANLNRRGFYSDGECNIFALREQVADGANWIRDLRIALWAEHLGLTPEYAAAALRDPAVGLALFDRKFTVGSRFTPFEAQPYTTEFAIQVEVNERASAMSTVALVAQLTAALGAEVAGIQATPIFDTFVDPSSFAEGP